MIFEGLKSILDMAVSGLEKLSNPLTLLDKQQLNEPIDFRAKIQGLDGSGKNPLNSHRMESPVVPPIAPHPTYEPIPGTGLSKVTDIFGTTRICDPNMVDFFSGLPTTVPDHLAKPAGSPEVKALGSNDPIPFHNRDQWKLDNVNRLKEQRDVAVGHYKDAKARGDINEMSKWEEEANQKESGIFNVLGISAYTLNPKAPGID